VERSVNEPRVAELLGRMTLAEKVGQLVQVTPSVFPDVEERIRAGAIGSIYGIWDASAIAHLRRIARDETRLGIPLIVGNDVIHGYGTIFPIPLAESCSWDLDLVEQTARLAAEEARANGTDWVFAPMVDICRDPRWGRIAEGAGEDPYLGGRVAAARVRGFQASGRVAACPKHYVAYGAAEGGRDYNTADISERTLRDVYLPPFKAAFDAGALSVMSAFNEIAGVPASANAFTLRGILRNELNWHGVVLSDYAAIAELEQHGIAADRADAARLGMLAGVDMDMMGEAYAQRLSGLVEEGKVPIARVDEAVGRVLGLKFRLGLFEREPIAGATTARSAPGDEPRALALKMAHESMVLLKNAGSVLPLALDSRVALVGPLADAHQDLLGCWSPRVEPENIDSLRDGLRAHTRNLVDGIQDADVIVAAVGETADQSGEAHSRAHLGLPGEQQALLDSLVETAKPVVVVLLTGRPLVVPRLVDQATAVLLAWHAGIRTGRAVADLLFGAENPSGRLTVSFPRTEGQIPVYYAHTSTGRPPSGGGTRQFTEAFSSTYLDESPLPLFPFGFGLGYTTFAYTDLQVETPAVETLVASATVTNTGSRTGTSVAQLYVRDRVASVTRPVRELKAFLRLSLTPGEHRVVRFEVPVDQLGFTGIDLRYTVEAGEFDLWISPDSASGPVARFSTSGGAATSSSSISRRQ
jgi:beta-glucosidase